MSDGRRPRALLLLLTTAGVLAIAVAVAIVLLVGRMPAPVAAPAPSSPAPAASTGPSPTPTEAEEPTASAVVLSGGGFSIVATDGSDLYSYDWHDDAAPAVTALAEAFGVEPSTSTIEGDGTHFPDYTSYDWDGFAFRDMVAADGGKPRDEYFQPSYVQITSKAVGDIAVTPEFDLQVGMPSDEVRSLGPDEEVAAADGSPRFFFAIDRSFDDDVENPTPEEYALWVRTDPTDQTVTAITYRPHSAL